MNRCNSESTVRSAATSGFCPSFVQASLRVLIMSLVMAASGFSGAQELLPGEMPVDFGRDMIDPASFPTVRELMERLDKPEQRAALVFRFYGDQHNHYAPQWSADGRSLAVLRSDIEAHTSKIVVLPGLDAEKPVVLYPESDSYDHMFAWSSSGSGVFAFASTNEPSEHENLHIGALGTDPRPKRVTTGPGIEANPALWTEGAAARLFFSLAGRLESRALHLERPDEEQNSQSIGDGTEASWSPDGQLLAWTERIQINANQSQYSLKLRDLQKQWDHRLFAVPGMLLRNPTWSPDGRYIAIYLRPAQNPVWRLYVVPVTTRGPVAAKGDSGDAGASKRAVELARDVRVEEHFQNFGPSWDPRGDRLWFFSRADDQEYYPLRWVALDGQRRGEVQYPRTLTTGLDVAVNPNPALRAIAFCAIQDLRQDVVVMILGHDPQ